LVRTGFKLFSVATTNYPTTFLVGRDSGSEIEKLFVFFSLVFLVCMVPILLIVWNFFRRVFSSFTGTPNSSAHDWELKVWKCQRAGKLVEALEACDAGLSLFPGNEYLIAMRDAVMGRLIQLDTSSHLPTKDVPGN
jgi:hypothetical protein